MPTPGHLFLLFALPMLALPLPASAGTTIPSDAAGIASLQRRLVDAGCGADFASWLEGEALEASAKGCPPQDPELRIETGMHTATIKALATDRACRIVATASNDKTVRLWLMPEGRLERTLRLPIDEGESGMAYAVALSSDGRHLAAGGWDGGWQRLGSHAVTLLDRTTGTVRRHGAFQNVVQSLAFSQDGRRLAVGLGDDAGLRVLDRESGRELFADKAIRGSIYGLTFAPDGALLVASEDRQLRRYGPDHKLAAKVAASGGKEPFRLAIDPSGKRLAVGYYDAVKASIVDAVTLKPIAEADVSGVAGGNLLRVGWSSDGSRLFAGGSVSDGSGKRIWRSFRPDGTRVGKDVAAATDALSDIWPCGPDMVHAAADPLIGLIKPDGTSITLQTPRTVDMRDKLGDSFTLSADAQTVRFGLGRGGKDPVRFDIQSAHLVDAPAPLPNAVKPNTDRLPVTDWLHRTDPKLGGKAIALRPYEIARSVAVQPDSSGFVLGTGWYMRAYDKGGTQRWSRAMPATLWGVNLSADGKILVAAPGDGTIRWHRWSDGKELLALFVEAPTKRWVAWTPSGYYMASPNGGEDLIGWHVNRGWEQEADFFGAGRFKERFNRPEVVQAVLSTLDEGKAVEAADAAARRKPSATPSVATKLPPVVTITGPTAGGSFTGTDVTVEYTLRSPTGEAIDNVEVLVDGQRIRGAGRNDLGTCPAIGSRGAGRPDLERPGTPAAICRLSVAVPPRDVEIALIARSGDLASEPARLRLAYAGRKVTPAEDETAKPRLYVLAVGVADYVDADLRLGFAGKDANDFAAALEAQKGGLYRDVVVKRLIDRSVTRSAVMEGLEWLEKEVTSRDIGVLFLAGHGMVDDRKRFWFLPADADAKTLRSRGLSQDDLMATLAGLAGKAILFLDACHAAGAARTASAGPTVLTRGAVDMNSVVTEFSGSESGVVVYGSSTGREVSLESSEWANGAFTKAVVEAIREGKGDLARADGQRDGRITLSELDAYVADRVKDLTGGRQHPVMSKPATVTNYPFAVRR